LKLVWAFDPFDSNRKLQQQAVALVKALVAARDRVEAVYVASPREISLATAFDVPFHSRFSGHPKHLVAQGLARLGLKQVRATVLTEDNVSVTSAARTLAQYAERTKAGLTLVASRARTGVSRLFLGSFAETLVHVSKTDLLVFHEGTRIWKRSPERLLYAHDLSRSDDRGFERALAHAKRWKATLHVVHVPDPAYGIRFDDQDSWVDSYRKQVQKKLDAIDARLHEAGVEGSVVIDAQWAPVSELILARAKRTRADLVAVCAKSGPLAGAMGGSVTRQILRASGTPVLVIKTG
jgi:nucleotide-binding universal stress UspA family protein